MGYGQGFVAAAEYPSFAALSAGDQALPDAADGDASGRGQHLRMDPQVQVIYLIIILWFGISCIKTIQITSLFNTFVRFLFFRRQGGGFASKLLCGALHVIGLIHLFLI